MTGTWMLLGTVAAALLAGALLRARDGRVRRGRAGPESARAYTPEARRDERDALPDPVADSLAADGITLVQISTTFCAPCRHARAVLRTVSETTPGVRHVDLDITERPHVGQRLGVLRTPTTIAYAADGTELLRVSGVPKLDRLRPSLAPLVQAHQNQDR